MLNAEQIDKLRPTIMGTGWNEIMKPILIERGRTFSKMVLSFESQRPKPYDQADDKFLKGMIHEMEWMLAFWENEIAVHDMNQRLEQQSRNVNGVQAGV